MPNMIRTTAPLFVICRLRLSPARIFSSSGASLSIMGLNHPHQPLRPLASIAVHKLHDAFSLNFEYAAASQQKELTLEEAVLAAQPNEIEVRVLRPSEKPG